MSLVMSLPMRFVKIQIQIQRDFMKFLNDMTPYKLAKSAISYVVLSLNNFSIFNLTLDLISNEVKSIHLPKLAVHHSLKNARTG